MAVPPLAEMPNCVELATVPPSTPTDPTVSPMPMALPALPPLLTSPMATAPPLADAVATPPLPADALSVSCMLGSPPDRPRLGVTRTYRTADALNVNHARPGSQMG